jgi:capsular exopolysaccharide synthesis family protein
MSMMRPDRSMLAPVDPGDGFGAFMPEPQLRSLDPARIWQTIVRRRKLFMLVAIPLFALVALFTILQKTQYSTNVRLLAGAANSDSSQVQSSSGTTDLSVLNAFIAARGSQTPETYIDLLLQPTIATDVASRLKIDATPKQILNAVKAVPIPDTAIVSLTATWTDPVTSAAIANNWADVFTDHERALIGRQADSLLKSTGEQLPEADAKVSAAQNELSAYEQMVNIVSLPEQTTNLVANQATLQAKLQAAQVDVQQAQQSLQTVETLLASTPPTVVGSESVAANPARQNAELEVSRLRAQLRQDEQRYTDTFPGVIADKAQLISAQNALKSIPETTFGGNSTIPNPVYQGLQTQEAQLNTQIASAQAQIGALTQQINQGKPDLASLPEKSRRIAELERALKAAQDYEQGLLDKQREATIAKSTAISDVTVTQAADPAAAVAKPNRVLNIALGTVLAIVLGLIAVFAAEFIDDRFRTADDIRDRLGLPLLGTIPQFDELSVSKDEWIKPLSVEAFHQLVASLRYASNDPPRSITFTSPDRGDGKSTVVYNTALSMGLMGQRVLVIDGDLRRPTVHEKFGVSNERGLADVLVGLASLEDVIRPTGHADVFVLTAGRPVPNPVALLQSETFDRVLREATASFQQVLVDGPALRPIVDGLMLGLKTDGVVLVVSSPNSNGRTVAAALAKLRSVGSINLLGIVLNATTPDKREFSPYYLGMGQSISLPTGRRS